MTHEKKAGDIQGKPFPNEHSARLNNPGKYKRFRREKNKLGDGIDVIWGVRKDNGKVEIQAIRFDSSKFTVAQARKWLKEHKYTPISFEKAEEKSKIDELVAASAKCDVSWESEGKSGVNESSDLDDKVMEETSGEAEKGKNMPATLETEMDASKKTLDKNARRVFTTEKHFFEAKAESPVAPNGSCEGYAVAWDVVDRQGEVMRRGAFAKSIQERVPAGKVLLMVKHFAHGGDFMDAVGKVIEMKEDEYGLWFRANFLKDEFSQKVRERVKDKVVQFTSIGYSPVKYGFIEDKERDRRLVEHTECKAFEVTLTAKPANEGAVLTGAKSVNVEAVKKTITALHDLLPKEGELAPEMKAKTLDEVFGSKEEAESVGKSVEDLLNSLRLYIGDVEAGSQSTKSPDGSTPPEGDAPAGKTAEGTPEASVASPEGKAEQHPPLSISEQLEKRRMACRRVAAKVV